MATRRPIASCHTHRAIAHKENGDTTLNDYDARTVVNHERQSGVIVFEREV